MNHFFVDDIEVFYTGPSLSEGALPSLFYFALSAEDSLTLDPFNQPVEFLKPYPLRIFSLTLPGHENKADPTKAIDVWAQKIQSGETIIEEFVSKVERVVNYLREKNLLIDGKLGAMGLSRGGFIAAHVCAKIPSFKFLLGFAPLTKLTYAKEFHGQDSDYADTLNLEHLCEKLFSLPMRFYIGNRDTRVSTSLCFQFIEKLSNTAFHHKIRSPKMELIISPSIGHQGHGTSKEIFEQGALWIGTHLGVIA